MERGQRSLDAAVAFINKKCGSSMKATVDVPSFLGKIDARHSFASPFAWCENVVNAFNAICESADGKRSTQAKVVHVQCRYDASATKEKLKRHRPVLSLSGRVLGAGYNLTTANLTVETRKFLEKNL